MGTLVRAKWWSGEVHVLVDHWPAFEVKFHRYFSYFLYLNAIQFKRIYSYAHGQLCLELAN
jgi:hypothetical protein